MEVQVGLRLGSGFAGRGSRLGSDFARGGTL